MSRALVVSFFAASLLAFAGCGDGISQLVSCNSPSDCPTPPGEVEADCCSGACVVASPGCDSGYRYITSEPEVGECAVQIMCAATPDMSVPRDLSSDEDGGA